jgi:hypothetical protein
VEIPWTRKSSSKKARLDKTVMGQLVLDGHRLKVEVNSARRAEIIRAEIEKRLGKHARYMTTEIQAPESMLEKVQDRIGETTGVTIFDLVAMNAKNRVTKISPQPASADDLKQLFLDSMKIW